MKTTLKIIATLGLLLVFGVNGFAVSIPYPFRVVDNAGNLVAGATVAIGATTLTSNTTSTLTATSVPNTAGEKVLGTLANPSGTIMLTLLDYGTGDYAILYDPTTFNELYLPLTVSKAATTITAANATISLICAKDSSYLTALPNALPAASGGLLTVGTGAGSINPDGTGAVPVSSGTGTGQISLSSGKVLLQATQTGVTIPTVTTLTNSPTSVTSVATGTAQSGTSTTIVLQAGSSATTDLYKGDFIVVSSGTGAGQSRVITGYAGGSVTATISRAWTVNPDSTSVYTVVANPHPAMDANLAVAANGVNGNVTGSVGSVTGSIGSISGITFPSNFGTFLIDGTGKVTLTSAEHTAISGTDVPTAITAAALATSSALSTVNTTVNTINTNTSSIPTSSAITTAVWAAGSRTITGGTISTYTGNTPQTGDSFGLIGTAGVGLTNIGDTRIAKLDANISTRMATYAQPIGFLAATFPGTVSSYAGADTAGTTTLLLRLPQTLQFDGSNYVKSNVYAYNTSLDPATEVLGATASSWNTASTIGAKINAAGTASDPWSTLIPGAYGSGTAGNIVGNYLNAAITSLPSAAANATAIWAAATRTLTAFSFTPTSTVGGYASGQDPATLLFVTPANKLATNGSGQVTYSNAAAPTANANAAALMAYAIGHGWTVGQLLVVLQAIDAHDAPATNAWTSGSHQLGTAYQFSGDGAPIATDGTLYPTTQTTNPAVTSRSTTFGTIPQP